MYLAVPPEPPTPFLPLAHFVVRSLFSSADGQTLLRLIYCYTLSEIDELIWPCNIYIKKGLEKSNT